jgi:GT2 family glycosyltransferase/ubiquinone/menaquinone biosynthesis C-methylase UbiE
MDTEVNSSSSDTDWGGERFVPGMQGVIELEHQHRYAMAARLAAGLVVLDVASGEGYGSAELARVAKSVLGVDISQDAVAHARRTYQAANLKFIAASCTAIPIEDASIDLIVSFETIEHHDQHDEMMREFKRVLKPAGMLIISSPDKHEYSDIPESKNEFHVRELYRDEFDGLLRKYFSNVALMGQRVSTASLIAPLDAHAESFTHFAPAQGGATAHQGIHRPLYFVALASNAKLPPLWTSAFDDIRIQSGGVEPAHASFELKMFWAGSLDSGLVEGRSSFQRVAFGLAPLDVCLPFPAAHGALAKVRVDIADQPALIYLEELQLCDAKGHSVWRWDGTEGAMLERSGMLISKTRGTRSLTAVCLDDDPRFELDLPREVLERLSDGGSLWVRIGGRHLSDAKSQVPNFLELAISAQATTTAANQAATAASKLAETLSTELRASIDRARRFEAANSAAQAQLLQIYGSSSWKLTRPLRFARRLLGRLLKKSRPLAAKGVKAAYRLAPVPTSSKLAIKRKIFAHAPAMFTKSAAYQRWHSHERTHGGTHSPLTPAQGAHLLGIADAGAVGIANGVDEWTPYSVVAQRIADVLQQRQQQAVLTAFPMRDLKSSEIAAAIATLRLPAAPASPLVSIIIPVFNQIKYTVECLLSVAEAASDAITFEVIIADDASNDGSADMLAQVANLKIVRQPSNLGFLRNCNAAAQQASGRLMVFLNNDVQVCDGWLEPLVAQFAASAKTGVAGSKIVYPNGVLQDAGSYLKRDGRAQMVGHGQDPAEARFNYLRQVEYCTGACLMVRADLFRQLGGFDDIYAPAYCEDSDLCLRVRALGFEVWYCPASVVVHHLSKSSNAVSKDFKLACIGRNLNTLTQRWQGDLDRDNTVRFISFYLPQFHPIPENDRWWGQGFTEWKNAAKAKPNFEGHYQPHLPADLGYYDLRLAEVMDQQAEMAERYGLYGMCFYYYWFAGKRLLEMPLERLLETGKPDIPFCLCWANENWTRRWDGRDQEVLAAQAHSPEDDLAVIDDLSRYLRLANYIRIGGKPLLVIYRVNLFPDFLQTSRVWRERCRANGVGEIYIAMVESFELSRAGTQPSTYGCDAAIEFPPQGFPDRVPTPGKAINPRYSGATANYNDVAVSYATRSYPAYKRFLGVMPGWDNTPRRQDSGLIFHDATPGAFQAWTEAAVATTRAQFVADERIIFVNAWNEWAEGAHLEPDQKFGHTFLEAVKNANEAADLIRRDGYALE